MQRPPALGCTWQAISLKVSHLEVARHLISELLGIFCNLVVQVDGGRVLQQLILAVDSSYNLGVAVANTHCYDTCECLHVATRAETGTRHTCCLQVVLHPKLPDAWICPSSAVYCFQQAIVC